MWFSRPKTGRGTQSTQEGGGQQGGRRCVAKRIPGHVPLLVEREGIFRLAPLALNGQVKCCTAAVSCLLSTYHLAPPAVPALNDQIPRPGSLPPFRTLVRELDSYPVYLIIYLCLTCRHTLTLLFYMLVTCSIDNFHVNI